MKSNGEQNDTIAEKHVDHDQDIPQSGRYTYVLNSCSL